MNKLPILALIIPCFNEELVLQHTIDVLHKKLQDLTQQKIIAEDSILFFIDDGSTDNSWSIIQNNLLRLKNIKAIKLALNCGHQKAILCGMQEITKLPIDITITIDADLQHDINALQSFVEKYNEGFEIVYGIRNARSDEGLMKKILSTLFYKLMLSMGVKIYNNHADFRLVSTKALRELSQFGEVNIFLRGLIPLIGFKHTTINYDQLNRHAGTSKYSLRKMFSLALDGITSFSITPLRIIFSLGLFTCFLATIGIINALWNWYLHRALQGWSSIVISIYFIGGVQLISIGIIGEYIGKIYKEVKRRPRYIIETKTY
jgi:glycosyltransferase involved in cell wall biosynthesis